MECNIFKTQSHETIFTGDWHLGSSAVNKVALERMINYIKRTGCNWYFLGDACESTPHGHKNFDHRTVDPELQSIGEQYNYFKKLIKPIAFQCGGLVCGNHDERNAKTSEIDMIQNICEDLEIPYLADSAYSRICYETYGENRGTLVYLIHGFSSSRQRGGKINALENLAYGHIADVYVCGHNHDLVTTNSIVDTMSREGNLIKKHITFGCSGTFLENISEGKRNYAEKAGYRPGKIGYLRALYNPVTRRIKMEEIVL